MNAILIVLAGLAATFLAARYSPDGSFTLADLMIGIFAGIAGVCLTRVLGVTDSLSALGLPLFLTCGLALGLESLQHRSLWR